MINRLTALQRSLEWSMSVDKPSTLYEEMQKSTQEWLIFDISAGIVAGTARGAGVVARKPIKPSVLPVAGINFINVFLFASWASADCRVQRSKTSIYVLGYRILNSVAKLRLFHHFLFFRWVLCIFNKYVQPASDSRALT